MKRLLLAPLLATAALAVGTVTADDKTAVRVRWFGHACFALDFPGGLVVMTDPYDAKKVGTYVFPADVNPDVVTISHEHGDHDHVDAVANRPEVLRGLEGKEWRKIDMVMTKKGVRIRTVGVFHDNEEGKARGKNTVFVFEPETKGAFPTFAHMGDLGHVLSDEQVKAIGPVDAVMIPVGGKFTVDAELAKKVCDQLAPRAAIFPMHYRTDASKKDSPLATADAFIGMFSKVSRPEGNETRVEPGSGEATLVALGWKPKEGDVKKGSGRVSISDARAWTNAQPGMDAPSFNLSFELEVEAGSEVTLKVTATANGKAVSLEDDDGNAVERLTLKKGEKKKFIVRNKEGAKGADSGKVKIRAALVAGDSEIAHASAEAEIQTVR